MSLAITSPVPSSEDLNFLIQESTVAGNVTNIFQAKVVGLLEDHTVPAHREFHAKILHFLEWEDQTLLLEDPSQNVDTPFSMQVQSWESEQAIEQWQDIKSSISDTSKAINSIVFPLDDSDRNDKISAFHSLKSAALSLRGKDIASEHDITVLANESDKLSPHFQELRNYLLFCGRGFIDKQQEALREFPVKTFPLRQSCLIEKISTYSSTGKVAFICGHEHGNPRLSRFKNEVKKLQKALSETDYLILDPRLLPDQL